MALNKIFIHRKDLSYSEVKESDSDITFIRKDALLEWAKGQASITEKLNGKGAMLKAWDALIDKIESL